MKFNIKRPETRDDIYEIEDKAEERLKASYNARATLRYMANDFSEVVFKTGQQICLSIDRGPEDDGVSRVKVVEYQDDQFKAEVIRQAQRKDEKAPIEYGVSEVYDTQSEAVDFIKEESGFDLNHLIEEGLFFNLGVIN